MAQMVSFAQNGEDVLLNRVFAKQKIGRYVDVGAFDPERGSITRHFYERGWRGINIEPTPACFQRFIKIRPDDINLQVGVSDAAGELIMHSLGSPSSSFDPTIVAKYKALGVSSSELRVPVQTLREICEAHVPAVGRTKDVQGAIDFMIIDVEGWEAKVISGADWQRFRPRVVVIEATEPNCPAPSYGWEPLLLAHDYLFAFFDGLNRFYVRAEDAALVPRLQAPANPFDPYIIEELAVMRRQCQQLEARMADMSRELLGREKEVERLMALVTQLMSR